MTLQPIRERFNQKGCIYTQVRRQGLFAIFSLQYAENGPVIGYDLVRLKIREKRAKNADVWVNTGLLRESLPTSGEWGESAWSFTTLEKAESALSNKDVFKDSICPPQGCLCSIP